MGRESSFKCLSFSICSHQVVCIQPSSTPGVHSNGDSVCIVKHISTTISFPPALTASAAVAVWKNKIVISGVLCTNCFVYYLELPSPTIQVRFFHMRTQFTTLEYILRKEKHFLLLGLRRYGFYIHEICYKPMNSNSL